MTPRGQSYVDRIAQHARAAKEVIANGERNRDVAIIDFIWFTAATMMERIDELFLEKR
jgi:hypothetical protein